MNFFRFIKNFFRKNTQPTPVSETDKINRSLIVKELLERARKEIGVKEDGGDNRGKRVEEYQTAINSSKHHAWCLSFVQWVVKEVTLALNTVNPLYPTEHCVTLWRKTSEKYKLDKPAPGSIFIYRYNGTSNGHTGWVEDVGMATYNTIEGNTSQKGSREGDCVRDLVRSKIRPPNGECLGFIDVPQMIIDQINDQSASRP